MRHLPKGEQAAWRRRLQRAYERPTYTEAKTALLDIEPRLHKVKGYQQLRRLREALKRELKLETTRTRKVA